MLLREFLASTPELPMICYTDNEATKETIEKPGVTARTKHFETWMQYCRERVLALEIIMQWIPTADMLADIFTKALLPAVFHYLRGHLLR